MLRLPWLKRPQSGGFTPPVLSEQFRGKKKESLQNEARQQYCQFTPGTWQRAWHWGLRFDAEKMGGGRSLTISWMCVDVGADQAGKAAVSPRLSDKRGGTFTHSSARLWIPAPLVILSLVWSGQIMHWFMRPFIRAADSDFPSICWWTPCY